MKKKLLTAVCGILLVASAIAQVPQSLNYQAVARNTAGSPIVNTSVTIRISIHDGSASGTVVYSERDTATTNQFGLFSCKIGTGNVISGTFTGIDWATGSKFMQVELDPAGGSSYTDMGITQLLSVPYALYAATSGDNNWIANGNDIHKSNSGNVGIGISSPVALLHVAGTEGEMTVHPDWTDAGTSVIASLTGAANKGGQLRFDGVTGGDFVDCGMNANGDFVIENSFDSPVITATQGGNVGIGTSTPNSSYKLEIAGANSGLLKLTGSNCCTQITMDDVGADDVYLTTEVGEFHIWTGGNNKRLSILPNGNVGIGNSTPAAKLDIAGSIKITDGSEGAGKFLVSDANGLATWQTVAVGTSSYTGLNHNRFYISTSTLSPYINITTAGSSVLIIGAGAPSNGFIHGFQHNGPDEVVIYNNNATNWTIKPGQTVPSVPFYTGPTGADYVIVPGKSVRVFYEPTTAKWWVLDGR